MDRSDPMTEFFDAHRPATAFDHDSTLVVAMELSGKSWQLGAVVPGVSRRPKRGLKVGDMDELLRVLERWKAEAAKAGRTVARVVVAYEAGRDGFWIARDLVERGIEVQVMQPASIPVERKGRRAKTDRIDLEHAAAHPFGLAARGAAGLRDGSGSQRGGRGCAPAGARAPQADARAGVDREPDPEPAVAARDLWLSSASEEGEGEAGGLADAVGREPAARDDGAAAAPDDPAAPARRAARRDRRGARSRTRGRGEGARSGAGTADDPIAGRHLRGGTRDRDAAGSRGFVPPVPRPDVERVGDAKGRIRKIMAVALARKLLVALWRYVQDGVIPEGARLAAA